jgi:AcrR family transcriptional regulator
MPKPAKSIAPNNNDRIDSALLELMGRGDPITHDAVAEQSGVSRRTVYRRFADQKALRQRVWELLSPPQGLNLDLQQLLAGGLAEQFRTFDSNAPAMTVTMASAEGRAIRNQLSPARVDYYKSVFGGALAPLDEPLRTQVTAALQVLCSGLAWREMRDQWGLDGAGMAAGCAFVITAAVGAAGERG